MSGWVRFENAMPENLKVAPVSDKGFRLWIHAVCYCSRAQTDGLVPTALVYSLSLTASKRTVEELVSAGLFEVVPTGYRVHDYLEHNPSRSRITELRKAAKDRTARWRDGSGDEPVTRHTDSTVTHNSDVTPHARAPRPHAPDLPLPTLTEEQKTVLSLCRQLAVHIRANDPKADPKPESERWLTDMRLLVADRGGGVAEVERIIDWCQADPFWHSNILSPAKLRKQFTQLLLKAKGAKVVPIREAREERRTRGSAALDGLIRASEEGGAPA